MKAVPVIAQKGHRIVQGLPIPLQQISKGMSQYNIQSVAIIGAGTMGLGIANVFAMKGYKTVLYDIAEAQLEVAQKRIAKNLDGAVSRNKLTQDERDAAWERLQFTHDFDHVVGDLVLEAVVEKLDLKRDLFNRLAKQNSQETIFATNTSTIPITQIGVEVPGPERLVGMHFFNPAHIMKLVEVISGVETSPEVAQTIYQLVKSLGKTPVMANDAPGFIVNRVARHFYVEGLKILEEGVTDHEGIDRLMESSGFKMGPFRLMDLIGVDTNFSVTQSMHKSFHYDSKFRPSRIQELKVLAGHHGRKSGKGFYDYQEA